jgi:Lrp/AsnC family transcriptional regulator for asnA, asnC and gidA
MKKFKLTKQDRKILSILHEDSRIGYKEIAAKTGVSITTVHNAIKKFKKNGIIEKFSIKIDAEKLGYDLTAIIGVVVNRGSVDDVIAKLIQHEKVCQIFFVTGNYDLMLVAKFKNSNELDEFLRGFLKKAFPDIKTNTSVVLNTPKERLNPPFDVFPDFKK